MIKLFFSIVLLVVVFTTASLSFGAILGIGQKKISPIDKAYDPSSNGDINTINEFLIRFIIGNYYGFSGLIDLNTGIAVGDKRIRGTYIVTTSGSVTPPTIGGNPPPPIDFSTKTEENTVDEEIVDILLSLDFSYGIRYQHIFFNFVKPYAAVGLNQNYFSYNTADIEFGDTDIELTIDTENPANDTSEGEVGWEIVPIQEDFNVSGTWYSYGINFEITSAFLIGLENKKNNIPIQTASNGRKIDFSSTSTNLYFNIGF